MLYSEPFPNAEIVARRERIKADFANANTSDSAHRSRRRHRAYRVGHLRSHPVPRSA